MYNGVVYWKHLPEHTNKETQGYIGITKSFKERMKQHYRDAFAKNSIYTIHEQMRNHGDSIITDIIFEGPINKCYDLEEQLRPTWHLGWNMAIGGGKPGSGWKPGKWLCNRLWHPKYNEEIINKHFTCPDLANKYNIKYQGLSSVLRGEVPHYKNWELANAQLSRKVKERHTKTWTEVYLLHNKNIGIYVKKSGNIKFHNYLNIPSKSGLITNLIRGTQHSKKNCYLITKKEWLTTNKKLEFK